MSTLAPITMVGGGLAGLSLGIALRKAGVPARILEAGSYPRHRVCGEFITGLDDATIERLGIATAFAGADRHRSVTWFRHERVIGRNVLPDSARAISRFTLDARLARLFTDAGGELVTHTRVATPTDEPGWVQTSGRRRDDASPWLGLKLHARQLATTDELELHLGTDAYVGLSVVEDGWINVCGLFRRRPGLQFERDDALPACLRASGLPLLAERIASAEIRSGSRSAVAGFVFDRPHATDDTVQLGDAYAMIPPFTGNGMAIAFTSAALALAPLIAWAREEQSWSETCHAIRAALARKLRRRLTSAACLHPAFLTKTGQRFLGAATRTGLLPFRPVYQLLH